MVDFSRYSRFAFARDGRILTVSFAGNAVNAVDAAMHQELAHLFIDLQDDEESDLIILTGQGRAFCAGGDFDWFDQQIGDPKTFRAIVPEAKRIVSSLLEVEKPVICRLNGAAAGLGATIALMCDVIIADERAVIGDPHVKVGLVAGDGGAIIWPQLIGYAKAKELLMTGDLVPAREAVAMGLINYAVPAEDLDAKVAEIAGKILANPRWAVRWTKVVANIPLKEMAAKLSDPAAAYEMLSNLTADRAEAVNAFRERRAPKLTGE
jgi:enoyl-CoA hydratase